MTRPPWFSSDSTFTITNIGTVGGLFATPIINFHEVTFRGGNSGLHKIGERPVVRNGKAEVRIVAFLSLGFDHRVLDGAYVARFTARLIENLQDTRKLLSEALRLSYRQSSG